MSSVTQLNNPTIIESDLSVNNLDMRITTYIGEIKMWAGKTPPTNFIWCDGQNISSYTLLVAALGGSTNAPDLRQLFIIGSTTNINENKINDLPKHNHSLANGNIKTFNNFYNGHIKNSYLDYIENNSTNSGVVNFNGTHSSTTQFAIKHNVNKFDTYQGGSTGNSGGQKNNIRFKHSHNQFTKININWGDYVANSSYFQSVQMGQTNYTNNADINNNTNAQMNINNSNININNQIINYTTNHADFIPKYKTIGFIIRYQ